MKTSRRSFLASGILAAAASPVLHAADSPPAATLKAGRRIFGRTGVEVSMMGCGCGSAFSGSFDSDPDGAVKALEGALALGVNYFDTAFSYKGKTRTSYELMAPFVEKHRAEIFLVSKTDQRSYDGFMREFEATLKALRTDHMDLMHIHALDPKKDADLNAIENGAVKAQRKLVEQKSLRFIGITGHSVAQIFIKAIKQWNPDCIMTIFPCSRPDSGKFEDELLPVAVEHKMGIAAMKTVRQARDTDLKGSDLIRYALSLPGIALANVGFDTLSHLQDNVAMTSDFKPLDKKARTAMSDHAQAALAGLIAPWDRPGYRDGTPVPV
jgi:aryl-alcohol dehydrogenase-like predicted oxidoreductase